jgi:hypothetical protein
MTPGVTFEVTILAPDEPGSERRANLFLYRVEENPYLRNQPPQVDAKDPTRPVPPPLSLTLHYLLTCYARSDGEEGNATAHHLLGEAMRVLHEHSVLPEKYLPTELKGGRERLQLVPHRLEAEELTRLWTTFGAPWRPSVAYRVSAVQLDVGTPTPPLPQIERVGRIGTATDASVTRPVLLTLLPDRTPAGAPVILTGQHLKGWRVTVEIGGQVAVETTATGDTLTVPVPAGLLPGLYEARVDAAHLAARTFRLEVTP